MSDVTIAILILPFLLALTLALECTRIGCTRLMRRSRQKRNVTPGVGVGRVDA